ncbi:MAG: ribosomal protein L7/L12 [Bdellovibrionota bacterium]
MAELPPTAISALERGNTIEAIKIVRQSHNLGLKEAKDLVDAYMAENPSVRDHAASHQVRISPSRLLRALLCAGIGALVYWWTQNK